jgi:hypothetical protein
MAMTAGSSILKILRIGCAPWEDSEVHPVSAG